MATGNPTKKPISTELQLKKLSHKKLKDENDDKIYDPKIANAPGLVVRVSKTGTKSFRWDRGSGHKPRIITYGTYPSLSLAEARTAHQKARQQHADGTLNLVIFEESLEEEQQESIDDPKIVAELAEMFYTDRILPKRKAPHLVRNTLDGDILPYIGEMRLSSVRPMLCRKVVKIVVNRGSTTQAGRVLAVMKQLFRFGVSLGLMEDNPAQSLEPDMLGIESNKRNRTLSSEEIRQLWEKLEETSVVPSTALKLLVLLGLRSGELRQAEWEHVDLDKGLLTIPVKNQKLSLDASKSALDFIVPLDHFSASLFRQMQGQHDVWVFPGRKRAFDISVMPHMIQRMYPDETDRFTPHDLRRTMRTGIAKLKIKPHIAERCLNHVQGKIEETYDTHDYLDERREALEKWSQHVQVVIGLHENVVQMERQA